MSLTKRIEALDRRWIFVLMLFAMSFPLIVHFKLPIRESPEARGFYESIEKLQAGDVVYLARITTQVGKPNSIPCFWPYSITCSART